MLIFMSDGHGSGGEAEMSEMARQWKHKGMVAHCLGFGSGSGDNVLIRLRSPFGDSGKFVKAVTGLEMVSAFKAFASQGSKPVGLIEAAKKRIAEMVSHKLVVDFC